MTSRREEEHYHSSIDVPNTIQFCKDIHTTFTENKLDFTAFSDKFIDPYGDNLLLKITTAESTPSDELEVDVIEGLTATVESVMDTGRIELQKLFNFVVDAFPKDSAKLHEVGKDNYEHARQVPARLILALGDAKDFADTYAVQLAGVGYSAAMATALGDTKTALNAAVNEQNKAQRKRPSKTQDRRTLINDMYDSVRDLCDDAKIIYVHDFAKYNLFLIPGVDKGSSVSGDVDAGGTANTMVKEFQPTDTLKVESTGSTDLMFCTAPDAVTACATGVTVPAGESVTVQASELGSTANQYLNVTNLDAGQAGSWKVTLG